MSGSLFDLGAPDTSSRKSAVDAPLAERMRPGALDQIVGLENIIGPGSMLRTAIEKDQLPSIILWGPPGSGKTTLGFVIAKQTRARFIPYSAATSGIKEAREIMEGSKKLREKTGQRTILFVDEIHRFNRAQQDAFLPYVERGDITLIGATTENPSFEVNSALLSRCRVVVLPKLETESVEAILHRALGTEMIASSGIDVPAETVRFLATLSAGDARQGLGMLESIAGTAEKGEVVTVERAGEIIQRRSLRHDRSGDSHYQLISAIHKSIRNSDVDATVYWLARMLEGGEDPMYVARRLVRAASEDIGLADPLALQLAVAAKDAVHFIGMPEGGVVLTQLAIYLAQAPKSNSAYTAWENARHQIRSGDDPPVPLHIRTAPTALMKELGYGRGYEYAHDHQDRVTSMTCLPESLEGTEFYEPVLEGAEKEIAGRLARIRKLREEKKQRG